MNVHYLSKKQPRTYFLSNLSKILDISANEIFHFSNVKMFSYFKIEKILPFRFSYDRKKPLQMIEWKCIIIDLFQNTCLLQQGTFVCVQLALCQPETQVMKWYFLTNFPCRPDWFDMVRVRKGGRLIDVYSHGSKRPICQNVSCEKLTIYSLEPIHEVHTHSTFPNNIH